MHPDGERRSMETPKCALLWGRRGLGTPKCALVWGRAPEGPQKWILM